MKTEKEGKERYIAKYYWWLSLGSRIAYWLFLLCIPSCIFQVFYNEHIYIVVRKAYSKRKVKDMMSYKFKCFYYQ